MAPDLEGEQGPFIMDVPIDVPSLGLEQLHVGPNVGKILVPAPRIHDQVDVIILDLGDDGVVDGAAALVGEDGEGAGAIAEPSDVGDDEALEEGHTVATGEPEAAHVGDVEEAGVLAAVKRRVHDGVLVLDGHAPSGERHHLGTMLHVEIVQGRLLELGLGRGGEGLAVEGLGLGEAAGQDLAQLPETASSHLG